jgi:hypothetical protein
LRNLDVTIDGDGTARVRAMVDEADWQVIEANDIFGASSRRRVPNELTGSGEVRITIEGPEEALDTGWQPHAEQFVIVDAMRRLDISDLEAEGVQGQAWQGIFFTAPAAWSAAVDVLQGEGFAIAEELDDRVSLTNDAGLVVEVIAEDDSMVVTVAVHAPLNGFEPSRTGELLEALNAINVAYPVSTNALDGDQLLTKAGVPVLEGMDLSSLIESLATGLVQLAEFLRGPLGRLASGSSSAAEALDDILG